MDINNQNENIHNKISDTQQYDGISYKIKHFLQRHRHTISEFEIHHKTHDIRDILGKNKPFTSDQCVQVIKRLFKKVKLERKKAKKIYKNGSENMLKLDSKLLAFENFSKLILNADDFQLYKEWLLKKEKRLRYFDLYEGKLTMIRL